MSSSSCYCLWFRNALSSFPPWVGQVFLVLIPVNPQPSAWASWPSRTCHSAAEIFLWPVWGPVYGQIWGPVPNTYPYLKFRPLWRKYGCHKDNSLQVMRKPARAAGRSSHRGVAYWVGYSCCLMRTTASLWRSWSQYCQTSHVLICWLSRPPKQHTRSRKPSHLSVSLWLFLLTKTNIETAAKENVYRVKFQYYNIGQRRGDLELRGNKSMGPYVWCRVDMHHGAFFYFFFECFCFWGLSQR